MNYFFIINYICIRTYERYTKIIRLSCIIIVNQNITKAEKFIHYLALLNEFDIDINQIIFVGCLRHDYLID